MCEESFATAVATFFPVERQKSFVRLPSAERVSFGPPQKIPKTLHSISAPLRSLFPTQLLTKNNISAPMMLYSYNGRPAKRRKPWGLVYRIRNFLLALKLSAVTDFCLSSADAVMPPDGVSFGDSIPTRFARINGGRSRPRHEGGSAE